MATFTAENDWPDSVMMYRLLEEQELLPDIAKCNCAEALVAVHDLRNGFTVKRRYNAEHMAPKKGHLPFLRIEDEVVGNDDILNFMLKKEKQLFTERTPEQDLCIKGVLSLIENKLIPIELYVVWVDAGNLKDSYEKYGFNQPQILKKILCYQKQKEIRDYLQVTGWLSKSKAEIINEARKIFEFLSRRFEQNKFIAGNQLSEADIYVYGHLQAILENKLTNDYLLKTLEQYPKLGNFCMNFNQVQLGKQAMIF